MTIRVGINGFGRMGNVNRMMELTRKVALSL